MKGLLRVLVNDGAWATIHASDSSTVQELISVFKTGFNNSPAPFMTLCYNENGLERILSSEEIPVKLIDREQTEESPFIRVIIPTTSATAKQQLVSDFCGFADVRAKRKDAWSARWIALKERTLTWSKTPRDKKIRGQIDLTDAYVEPDGCNDIRDACVQKKPMRSFVLKIVKPDRLVKIRFESTLLLNAWLHVLKAICASDPENSHFDSVDEQIEQQEFNVWGIREERFGSLCTLSNIIECPLAFDVFLSYLKRSQSEEGLLFWQAVNKFKNPQISDENAVEIARSIHDKFIAEGSQYELPLSCSERSHLVSIMETRPLKRAMFDGLVESMLRQLQQEKFTDFKKSSCFRNMLISISKSSVDQSIPPSLLEPVSWDNG